MSSLSTTAHPDVDVIVVGAGAIGAAVAAEVAARGRSVVVVDRGADWAAGCSWGNAGLICPSHAGPWATRADVSQGARWMLRRDSPLGLRPRPALVPFLGRLLTLPAERVEASRLLSRRLCLESLALHEKLATEHDTGFARHGLLDSYWTRGGLDRAGVAAELHRASGVRCEVLDADATRDLEPALGPGVEGGVFFPDEAHCDPAAYVAAEATRALERGARFVPHADVVGIDPSGRGRTTVLTTQGAFRADEVVVAAGAWSRTLAFSIGHRIPLQPGKGYTVDLTAGDREPLARPLMLQEARIAVTPLHGRLRLAGTMELSGIDTSIDRRRIAAIHRAGVSMMPGWSDAPVQRMWAGMRPCTPDGLPLIGRLGQGSRITLATGHAMLGLTLAPLTGLQVADVLDGTVDDDVAAMDPTRRLAA